MAFSKEFVKGARIRVHMKHSISAIVCQIKMSLTTCRSAITAVATSGSCVFREGLRRLESWADRGAPSEPPLGGLILFGWAPGSSTSWTDYLQTISRLESREGCSVATKINEFIRFCDAWGEFG